VQFWESQIDNPQAAYNELTGFDFGHEVVADQFGIYPDRMGRSAQILFKSGD
jgi:hypothetical protein